MICLITTLLESNVSAPSGIEVYGICVSSQTQAKNSVVNVELVGIHLRGTMAGLYEYLSSLEG
jgi:hypothetical protein